LVWGALPRRKLGSELKPCRAELRVVWGWRTGEVVHAVGHALQNALGCQPLQGGS